MRGDVADRIRRFLPMVRGSPGMSTAPGRPGIELEDLMQAGLVALTECAQRHDGPGEDGFAAYAKLRVRGAMVDLIRRTVPLSRGAAERRRQLRVEAEDAAARASWAASRRAAELAEAMGIDAGRARGAARRRASRCASNRSTRSYSDSDTAFADDRPDSLALLARTRSCASAVIAAIAALPERLQLVIQLYFVEELNLSEIAGVLSVSVPRVHQLKAQALAQLRAALADVAEIL